MIKEGFLIDAYLFPVYILIYFNFGAMWVVIPLLLMTGSIILINKKRKLFPYLLIYIFLLFIHLFIGLLMFGLRHGET
jgi:hypothetical protein